MATYKVKSGDTLGKIAKQYGVKYQDITGYRSGNPDLIYPGEVLNIPGQAPAPGQPGFIGPVQPTTPTPQPTGQPVAPGGVDTTSKYIQDPTNPYASIPNPNYKAPATTTQPAPTVPYWEQKARELDATDPDKARWYRIRRPSGSGATPFGEAKPIKEPEVKPPPGRAGGVTVDTGEVVSEGGEVVDQETKDLITLQDLGLDLTDEDEDVYKTSDEARRIEEKIEGLEAPVAPTYESDFDALRDEHGMEAIETQLTTLKKDIADREAVLRQDVYTAEGRLAPMGLIGEEQLALKRQAQEDLDSLLRRKAVLIDEYNVKANLINQTMTLKQMDYNAARDEYNDAFNKQIALLNIIEKRENRQQQEENRQRDDARANWQIMSGLIETGIKEGNISSYDALDDEVKVQIKSLEMKGGIPVGITEAILASISPEKTVSTKIISKDKSQVSILYEDGSVEVFNTGLTPEVPTGVEGKKADIADIETQLLASRGEDGYVDPYKYKDLRRQATISPSDFDKRFKDLLSSQERKNLGIDKADAGGAVYQTDTGEELDLSTPEGLKRAKELNYSYGAIYSALDEDTKLTTGSIKELLKEAGFVSAKEKENAILDLKATIDNYKDLWKAKGDKNKYGTREEFRNKIADKFPELTKDEIMDEIYRQVSNEWLKENKKWWKKSPTEFWSGWKEK